MITGKMVTSIVLGALFAIRPSAAVPVEVHVYLANEDHITGQELSLDDKTFSLVTPHCGRMAIERAAVKGISHDTDRASDILQFVGESDVVHNLNGDRLSGRVLEIKDDAIFLEASFAQGKRITVRTDQLDYLVFASVKKAEPTTDPADVRVIFTNGDVISGKVTGFQSDPGGQGKFVFDPPYSKGVQFPSGVFRSIHSATQSREFFPGGVAEALMDVLEKSGEAAGVYGQIYPSLVKSLLKDGDKKGALLVFKRVSSYLNEQYAFQRIGDEFLASNMLDAAVEAYEKMLEKSPTYYYSYTKLFEAYVKMGKDSDAAEVYERLLSNPAVGLDGYGTSLNKIRMDLSDTYIRLKEFDKAAEQLRKVVVAPPEQEDVRATALAKLISLFREQGKIDALTERYRAELSEKNRILGESYLEMIRIYLEEGKVMKAKTYVQRLQELGLSEYAEKARQLIKE